MATRLATEPIERLLRDLRTRSDGLSPSEVEHRRMVYGPNEVERRGARRWPRQLARQVVHPFALLLLAAATLALVDRTPVLAAAIAAVVFVNAIVAFAQERQAERAVEALGVYLPQTARALRGGRSTEVAARDLVPGDVIVIDEGTRAPADVRLLAGSVEIDLSSLTGESVPVTRAAHLVDANVPILQARDLVFSGTACVGGSATGVVFATGMRTEIGRIAALSEHVSHDASPLERQVRRLAWVIAAVGLAAALAFLALGTLAARLPPSDALAFSIGLLVANVPEGLLPTLTLALALAVRLLARTGDRTPSRRVPGSAPPLPVRRVGRRRALPLAPPRSGTTRGIPRLQRSAATTPSQSAGRGAVARQRMRLPLGSASLRGLVTPERIRAFRERGYLYLPGAFGRRVVEPLRKRVFDALERLDIWAGGRARSRKLAQLPIFQQTGRLSQLIRFSDLHETLVTPALHADMCELAGAALSPAAEAQLLVSLPHGRPWTLEASSWHRDVARTQLRSIPGVQIFTILHDLEPRGGATLALAGSQHLKNPTRAIALADDLAAGGPGRTATVDGVELSLLEMTGKAGDVYLMDMRVVHSPSINASRTVRMTATTRHYRL